MNDTTTLYHQDTLLLEISNNQNLLLKQLDDHLSASEIYQQHLISSMDSLIAHTSKGEEKFLNKISYNTIFTVSVTLLIFVFGIITSWVVKRLEKRSQEKKLKKYFKYYLAIVR